MITNIHPYFHEILQVTTQVVTLIKTFLYYDFGRNLYQDLISSRDKKCWMWAVE